MAANPSDLLKLELIIAGSEENTWGDKINGVFGRLENAEHGLVALTTALTSPYTLDDTQYTGTESHKKAFRVSGTQSAPIEIIVPARPHIYVVLNDTTSSAGPWTVTFKTSGQTGVATVHGERAVLWCNGTDVESIFRSSLYPHKANNLSDLSNTITARTNLGLGTAAVANIGTLAANVPTTALADDRYKKIGVDDICIEAIRMAPWPIQPCGSGFMLPGAQNHYIPGYVLPFPDGRDGYACCSTKLPKGWTPSVPVGVQIIWTQDAFASTQLAAVWSVFGTVLGHDEALPPGWHAQQDWPIQVPSVRSRFYYSLVGSLNFSSVGQPGDMMSFIVGRRASFSQDTFPGTILLRAVLFKVTTNAADDA